MGSVRQKIGRRVINVFVRPQKKMTKQWKRGKKFNANIWSAVSRILWRLLDKKDGYMVK